MMKLRLIFLIVFAVFLAGCASTLAAKPDANGEVQIDLKDYAIAPQEIHVKAGQTVRLVVYNTGSHVHELMIGRDVMVENNITEGFAEDFFAGITPEVEGPGMIMGLPGMEMNMPGMDMSQPADSSMEMTATMPGMDMTTPAASGEMTATMPGMDMSTPAASGEMTTTMPGMDMTTPAASGEMTTTMPGMDMSTPAASGEMTATMPGMDMTTPAASGEMTTTMPGMDMSTPAASGEMTTTMPGMDMSTPVASMEMTATMPGMDMSQPTEDMNGQSEGDGHAAEDTTKFGPISLAAKGDEHAGLMVMIDPMMIPADQATILTFTVPADKVGRWEMACFRELGQHYDDGMRGVLIVDP